MRNPYAYQALEYSRRWPVLPLAWITEEGVCGCRDASRCRRPGKHPLIQGGVNSALRDEEAIAAWWEKWPLANIGIGTGRQANLLVLDVDPRNGGAVSLARLRETYGELPETPVCSTGGGGLHIFFEYPRIGGGILGKIPGHGGLDIKADGGYVVSAPSLHVSGRRYQWLTDWDLPLAPAPEWLLKLIIPPAKAYQERRGRVIKPGGDPIELPELGVMDFQILQDLQAGRHGRIYRLLAQGDWEAAGAYRQAGPYRSPSEADLALMNKLVQLTRDPGRAKALFLETGLGQRDKVQDREDYLDRTVRTAMAGLDWKPPRHDGAL